MNVPFVDLHRHHTAIKDEIDVAIREVINDSAFVGGRGNKYVTRFEGEWAEYLDVRHVIGCANGTDALEIVLEALGIGPGDEVIVPAMTWISTAGAVVRVGAKPVFVDIHPSYYTIDVSLIENAISERTKAIIPVHLYGLPAEMDEIMAIASRRSLYVVEDAAQAHGAEYKDRKTGTLGDAAIFSFYPGKNLGAFGDAGCVVTNKDWLAEEVRRIGNHGQVKKHDFRRLGRNSRLDGLQAAILSVKLRYLDQITSNRKRVADFYHRNLADSGVRLPEEPDFANHVYHLFVVETDARESVRQLLSSKDIQTGVHYPCLLPALSFLSGSGIKDFPVADTLSKSGLSLPMFAEITAEEQLQVIESLSSITVSLRDRV